MNKALMFGGATLLLTAAGTLLAERDGFGGEAFVHPLVGDSPFRESVQCAPCHEAVSGSTSLKDSAGRPVGMYDLWRSSMMANSARDPFWRAMVSAEMERTPSRADEIEQKCMRCHAPMASADGFGDTEFRMSFDRLGEFDEIGILGQDGVSCTVCHAIPADDLGDPSTFSGGFHINDQQEMYGPHSNLFGFPMQNFSGLQPVTGTHIKDDSGLCGTCHTLFTEPLLPDGTKVGGKFPEQTPYLEWRNSVYTTEVPNPGPQAASCQSCHVPNDSVDGVPIITKVAHPPGGGDYGPVPPRTMGRHLFVGGNTIIPAILRDNASALGVTAPRAAFDATIAAARSQLQNNTGNLTVVRSARIGSMLELDIKVENITGHKLPSAYPSRRAWLRVRARNSAGNLVFVVGDHDADGRIVDAAGAPLPSEAAGGPLLTHQQRVVSADAPQVYEQIMGDSFGNATFSEMRAASVFKDTRLLPLGWSATHPEAVNTSPEGIGNDPDFVGGSDIVTIVVPAPAGAGPYTIDVDLLYQTISSRFAAELFTINTPDVTTFQGYYQAANKTPEQIATVQAQL